ncbi:hypothetical protein Tco_1432203 [Tanacetum coccineum]
MDSDRYLEGKSMQRPPLFESETKLDEVVPFEKQIDDLKRRLAKTTSERQKEEEVDSRDNLGTTKRRSKEAVMTRTSDSGEEDDEKVNNEACLVAQAPNEIDNEKLKGEALKLTKFEKSTHCLNEMLSNQKPFGDRLGLGFNSFEASSSGTKEIKFMKAQKKASSDGGPINIGGPQSEQAAPKIIMGPPVATLGSEKSVSFQKSILGPRPKHIIVNNVKVPVASNDEVKQFYKPLSNPGIGFSNPKFR